MTAHAPFHEATFMALSFFESHIDDDARETFIAVVDALDIPAVIMNEEVWYEENSNTAREYLNMLEACIEFLDARVSNAEVIDSDIGWLNDTRGILSRIVHIIKQ